MEASDLVFVDVGFFRDSPLRPIELWSKWILLKADCY